MSGPCVIATIERPPAELTAALAEFDVAAVHEAYRQRGLLHPGIRPTAHGQRSEVVEAARPRTERERAARARYERGELSLDVNNLRDVLQRLGVTFVDGPGAGR